MPHMPTTPEGRSTMVELIYAIRALAQTVELYHSDLRHLLEEASRSRSREADLIKDAISENRRSLESLPFELANRRVDDDVRHALDDVILKLQAHMEQARGAAAMEGAPLLAAPTHAEEEQASARIQFTKSGMLQVALNAGWAKKVILIVKIVVIALSAGGGVAFIKKLIEELK